MRPNLGAKSAASEQAAEMEPTDGGRFEQPERELGQELGFAGRALKGDDRRLTIGQRHPIGRPIELTCAFEILDELDLELSELEWWQLDANGRKPGQLLWRSGGRKQDSGGTKQSGQQAARVGGEYAVIDYVTRANGSVVSAGEQDEVGGDGGMKLIRVGHLIFELEQQQQWAAKEQEQRLLLCRVTNLAGKLDILYSLTIDARSSASKQLGRQDEAQMGAPLEREQTGGLERLESALSSALGGQQWSLEGAKLALAAELANPKQASLFLPLHLPAWLLKADEPAPSGRKRLGAESRRGAEDARAEGPVVAFESSASGLNGNGLRVQGGRSRLRSSALALVARFTSNQGSLIGAPEGESQAAMEEPELVSRSSQPHLFAAAAAAASSKNQSLMAKLSSTWRTLHSRHLDRWIQFAIGEAPLLLALCGGLLAGCLLTVLIVFRFGRSRGSQRRVADSKWRPASDGAGPCSSHPDKVGHLGRDKPLEEPESPPCGGDSSSREKQLASGGSSSSTNGDSQRKLILASCNSPSLGETLKLKAETRRRTSYDPIRTVSADVQQQAAAKYDRLLDSSWCQSDEMNADDASADLDDSIGSHAFLPTRIQQLRLGNGGGAGAFLASQASGGDQLIRMQKQDGNGFGAAAFATEENRRRLIEEDGGVALVGGPAYFAPRAPVHVERALGSGRQSLMGQAHELEDCASQQVVDAGPARGAAGKIGEIQWQPDGPSLRSLSPCLSVSPQMQMGQQPAAMILNERQLQQLLAGPQTLRSIEQDAFLVPCGPAHPLERPQACHAFAYSSPSSTSVASSSSGAIAASNQRSRARGQLTNQDSNLFYLNDALHMLRASIDGCNLNANPSTGRAREHENL